MKLKKQVKTFLQNKLQNASNPDALKPLGEHFADIKSLIVHCILVLLFSSVICSFYYNSIIAYIKAFVLNEQNLHYFQPFEPFFLHIKISIFCGIVVSFPLLVARITYYILPIVKNYKMVTVQALALCFLFEIGVAIAFWVVLPKVVNFMFLDISPHIQIVLGASPFFGTIFTLCFVFGIVMQFPLLIWILVSQGVVGIHSLKKFRKFHICGSFIIGGIITPPDVFSQIIVALLLIILFEITLFFTNIFYTTQPCKGLRR